MNAKPKIAILWLGACGGCDQAIIDLNELLLEVATRAEVLLWPIALDHKYDRIAALPDGALALSIIHGNIRNTDHVSLARLLRRKSQMVLGFGTCAVLGGVAGLANLTHSKDILTCAYPDGSTGDESTGNQPVAALAVGNETLTLPHMLDHLYTLDQVIQVDGVLPGCPPPGDLVAQTIFAALAGKLPGDQSADSGAKALCAVCPRNGTKPDRLEIDTFQRIHEVSLAAPDCFLAKGVICLGPTTRSGCGGSCLTINTPCRGCFGPLSGVVDGGSRFLMALASLLRGESAAEIAATIEPLRDLVGYGYRFSQPTSILGTKTFPGQGEES